MTGFGSTSTRIGLNDGDFRRFLVFSRILWIHGIVFLPLVSGNMKFEELRDFYEIFAMHESMPEVVKKRIETRLSGESKFWRAIFEV